MDNDGDVLEKLKDKHEDFSKIKVKGIWNNVNTYENPVKRIVNLGGDNSLKGIRKIAVPRKTINKVEQQDISVYTQAVDVYKFMQDNLKDFQTRLAKLKVPSFSIPKELDIPDVDSLNYIINVVIPDLDKDLKTMAEMGTRAKANDDNYKNDLKTIQRLFSDIDRLLKAIEKLKEDFTILTGDLKHTIDFKTADIPKADYDFEMPKTLPKSDDMVYTSGGSWSSKVTNRLMRDATKEETIRL